MLDTSPADVISSPPRFDVAPGDDAWMTVSLSTINRTIVVGMSERAFLEAWDRWSETELVLRWEEFKALGEGVNESPDETGRHARLIEGLRYFGDRQSLPVE